ncbi:glycosyltransferase, partial [Staphylococcus equorum]
SNGVDVAGQFNYENISENSIEQIKHIHDIKRNDTIVTFIGRLVEEKGVLDYLESFNKLTSKNIKFIVIGALHESERDLNTVKKLEKYKNNKNIIFTGKISNVNEYLALSDIFCLPSYREGMPRSIIEAMAMKNAIIATNIRGSREEVINEETGYLVPLKSSKFIANKIDELANDKIMLEQFKESGYRRAKEKYNENNVINKQMSVFNKN